MIPNRPVQTAIGLLSLLVGWIHFIFATLLSIGLLIYLCVFYHKSHDSKAEISATGLPTLVFLFLFGVLSIIFDILLIRGILQRRILLISFYVYGNYVAMAIIGCLGVYNFIQDLINHITFSRTLMHLSLHGLTFGAMIYLVYPVYLLYKEMRNPIVHPEEGRLGNNELTDQPNIDRVEGGADNPEMELNETK